MPDKGALESFEIVMPRARGSGDQSYNTVGYRLMPSFARGSGSHAVLADALVDEELY